MPLSLLFSFPPHLIPGISHSTLIRRMPIPPLILHLILTRGRKSVGASVVTCLPCSTLFVLPQSHTPILQPSNPPTILPQLHCTASSSPTMRGILSEYRNLIGYKSTLRSSFSSTAIYSWQLSRSWSKNPRILNRKIATWIHFKEVICTFSIPTEDFWYIRDFLKFGNHTCFDFGEARGGGYLWEWAHLLCNQRILP